MKIDFAAKRRTVTVNVPELDASFRLRALSVAQTTTVFKLPDEELKGVHLLALAIIDDDGNSTYSVDELKEMPASVFKLLTDELDKLHSFGKTSEDVVKN